MNDHASHARDPAVKWIGLDIPDSPELRARMSTDARFETFDGLSIPFVESSFDLVYCRGRCFNRVWGRWWGRQSPLNRVIDLYGRALRLDTQAINATKLLFCGQFAFLAQHR